MSSTASTALQGLSQGTVSTSNASKSPLFSGNMWISVLLILVGGMVLYLMYRLRKVESEVYECKNTQYTDKETERVVQRTLHERKTWEYLRDRIYDLDDQELSETPNSVCSVSSGQCGSRASSWNASDSAAGSNRQDDDEVIMNSGMFGGMVPGFPGLAGFAGLGAGLPGMMGVHIGIPGFSGSAGPGFSGPRAPQQQDSGSGTIIEEVNEDEDNDFEDSKDEDLEEPESDDSKKPRVRWEDLENDANKIDE
jgi:hypothetical protein